MGSGLALQRIEAPEESQGRSDLCSLLHARIGQLERQSKQPGESLEGETPIPLAREVAVAGLERGEIHFESFETDLRTELERTYAGAVASLYDGVRPDCRGYTTDAVRSMRVEVREVAGQAEELDPHWQQAGFSRYFERMISVAHRLGVEPGRVGEEPILGQALWDHIRTEFDLYRELGFRSSRIGKYGSRRSVFCTADFYYESERRFGGPFARDLPWREMAYQTAKGVYTGISEAARAYRAIQFEVEQAFGHTWPLLSVRRTAAFLIFQKVYPNADAAKSRFEEIFDQVKEAFCDVPLTLRNLNSIACLVFNSRSVGNVNGARRRFDAKYEEGQSYLDSLSLGVAADVLARFARHGIPSLGYDIQTDLDGFLRRRGAQLSHFFGDLPLPDLTSSDPATVWNELEPFVAVIENRYRRYPDCHQEAVSDALELISAGERRPEIVLYNMVVSAREYWKREQAEVVITFDPDPNLL